MEVLGVSDESFVKATGKTFSDIVEDQANLAISLLRKSLQDKVTLTTSKKLEQSIIALPIQFDGKTLSIEIQAEDYWKFINSGVQGVGGKMKNGNTWVNKSPSSPFSFNKEKKPSVKHFVQWSYLAGKSPFAVRETVFRSGIKANHFFDDVINGSFEKQMAEALTEAMTKTIEVDIKTDFEK